MRLIDCEYDSNSKLVSVTMEDDGEACALERVRHGRWETVYGVMTPGGDALLRCPYCKSEDSEHLCGVEIRIMWNYCPVCGVKMDL